ncbi:MAG: septum formation initiator family protein [Pseudoflavonifractor sp.]|nr:septum formation initiator family protein [Alloprevotella sp.]MCM1117001.1 septum formation initiator family protein [Pseudoflavonifractor sp.]
MHLNQSHPAIAWIKRYVRPSFILTAAIIAFVLFFNDNSLLNTYEHEREIDRLKAEIKECRDTLTYYHALNVALNNDVEAMERIVRERYHMQRPSEDVYIFE